MQSRGNPVVTLISVAGIRMPDRLFPNIAPLTTRYCKSFFYFSPDEASPNGEEHSNVFDVDSPSEIARIYHSFILGHMIDSVRNLAHFAFKGCADKFQDTFKIDAPNPQIHSDQPTLAFIQSRLPAGAGVISEKDPYSFLGLDSSRNDQEVKKAFNKLMLLMHPDKQSKKISPEDLRLANEATQLVGKAYKAIKSQRHA